MATIRKTVTFTAQQDKWIVARIAAKDFTNDSEIEKLGLNQRKSI